MIKNGKYFVTPPDAESDFKRLFQQMAAAGAGRPADKDGFPVGQWTPELLADAISKIDANCDGIDLRTVQHWFQENDKGISADNIRWLARIFGCGDPEASNLWQVELSLANRRLAAERKKRKSSISSQSSYTDVLQQVRPDQSRAGEPSTVAERRRARVNPARQTEALFTGESSMALPLVVFIGASALGLISFTLNIHSIVFATEIGPSKQIGFLWAPNWTITFLTVLPLFLALVIDVLRCWKEEWRIRMEEFSDPTFPAVSWDQRVTAASYTFWATLVVTVIIASGYNWVATHLIPLLNGDPGNWAVDWGRIAIFRPDLISLYGAILFTGLVFLYNGFTAYVFFSGLIFLHLIKHDYVYLVKGLVGRPKEASNPVVEHIGFSLITGIFRCASLGIFITILMKLQSSYLQSNSTDIVGWLAADFLSPFSGEDSAESEYSSFGTAPGSYYSFFCLLAITGTFANASFVIGRVLERLSKLHSRSRYLLPWVLMNGSVALLVACYFLTGVLPGFTIFLLFSMLFSAYLFAMPVSAWHRTPCKGK